MPRNVTILGGLESAAEQIPISLVLLDIQGRRFAMNDVDITVYLDPVTNAVAMTPLNSGFVAFTPYAGLQVPEVEANSERMSSDVTIAVSNENEDWFVVMAEDQFREAPATIWQGNLLLAAGAAPDAVTLQGAVTVWSGRIETIEAQRDKATITLTGHTSAVTVTIPRRSYTTAAGFTQMPKPGSSLKWGYTEETV
jgi:hypothetical protein